MEDSHPLDAVLGHYLKRLEAAIVRSPLLNATCLALGRGSRIDLTHLNEYEDGASDRLLDRILNGNYTVNIRHQPDIWSDEEELIKLHRQIERNLVRGADKIERETGNRSLWLGYPLLYMSLPDGSEQSILAPLLLWPMQVNLESDRQFALSIKRDDNGDEPLFNPIMRAWIERKVRVHLDAGGSTPENRAELTKTLNTWLGGLDGLQTTDLSMPLVTVPKKTGIPKDQPPSIINAGVLGVMRWQNQAIMDDLNELLKDQFIDDGAYLDLFLGQHRTPETELETAAERDRHHVSAADYSQEQAILKARRSPGVVIHGPPGTGKSQTITNIVADALAREETVLVVCQKRAAIDVVAQRLSAAGLGDQHLVVHDATADRLPVINLLKDQIDTRAEMPADPSRERKRLCREIESMEQEIDEVHFALCRVRSCGLSFRGIMSQLLKLQKEHPQAREVLNVSEPLGRSTWDDLGLLNKTLARLASLFVVADPLENPWRNRVPSFALTPVVKADVESTLSRLSKLDSEHVELLARKTNTFPIVGKASTFREGAQEFLKAVDEFLARDDAGDMLSWIAKVLADQPLIERSRNIVAVAERLQAADIDERISELIPTVADDELRRTCALTEGALEFRNRWFPRLRSSYRNYRQALAPILQSWAIQWEWTTLQHVLNVLRERSDTKEFALSLGTLLAKEVDVSQADMLFGDAKMLEGWLAWLDGFFKIVVDTNIAKSWSTAAKTNDLEQMRAWRDRLASTIERCTIVEDFENNLGVLSSVLQKQFLVSLFDNVKKGESIGTDLKRLERGFKYIDELQQYDRLFAQQTEDCQRIVLELAPSGPSTDVISSELAEQWTATVRYCVLMYWWREATRETRQLAAIHDEYLERSRDDLGRTVKEKIDLEPKMIQRIWANRAASQLDGKVGLWRRLLVKTGRNAMRLRQIVKNGQGLGLFDLRPCWLTNPDTACRILPLVQGLFDVVVFDEASQLPVEQAVPVVYRGRRIIVAGDEHQLPPTSFFQTRFDDDVLDGSVDTDDGESDANAASAAMRRSGIELARNAPDLLELSQNVLPEQLLNVHYRSRHPALIQFSNWAYYKGRLEAAHPVWGLPDRAAAPILVHEVAGVYADKTNLVEAQYIVKMLERMWSVDTEVPTIGVVTFNLQQEKLIEQQIDRRAYESANFRARLEIQRGRKNEGQDVGFFVKNLESVQGDERDVIIFSTTFGRVGSGNDAQFRRFFGPLTQSGGERRLNVAVTRARDGMIVVTSMPFDLISDVSAGVLPGRQIKARDYLQSYMYYANAVSNADISGCQYWLEQASRLSGASRDGIQDGVVEFDSELEQQVYDRLVSAGYEVDTQVGEAGFRIDLAVRHPNSSQGYLLGIECDGATYHSDRSARMRDSWRQSVLESYGWEIFRIWSTRWWTHADQVMDELLERLEQITELSDSTHRFSDWVPEMEEIRGEIPATPLESTGQPQPVPAARPTRARRRPQATNRSLFTGQEHRIEVAGVSTTPPTVDTTTAANKLKELLATDRECNDYVVKWTGPGNTQYHLALERQRGIRFLHIYAGEEVVEHVRVDEVAPDVASDIVSRLTDVESHNDIIDWFRQTRSQLFPDVW